MEGIDEPVARPLELVLRRAVLDLVRSETRRVFPPLVHVGWPGLHQAIFAGRLPGRRVDPADDGPVAWDHALRCDVLAAMVRRAGRSAPAPGAVPMIWLTRPGELELEDTDQAWLAAARAASAEAGIALTMVVATRHGWVDPRSGVRREWKRLRES